MEQQLKKLKETNVQLESKNVTFSCVLKFEILAFKFNSGITDITKQRFITAVI